MQASIQALYTNWKPTDWDDRQFNTSEYSTNNTKLQLKKGQKTQQSLMD